MSNKLYFGDNLHILGRYINAESVDLIYLDPPFNFKANYNIVFAASKVRGHRAQIQAFEDNWHWNEETEETFEGIENRGGPIATVMEALHLIKGRSDLMAYLVMMTVRLVEMHRVLKDTGSLYSHCDPAASHYIKIILDAIFSAQNFRNENVWQRLTIYQFLCFPEREQWEEGLHEFGDAPQPSCEPGHLGPRHLGGLALQNFFSAGVGW